MKGRVDDTNLHTSGGSKRRKQEDINDLNQVPHQIITPTNDMANDNNMDVTNGDETRTCDNNVDTNRYLSSDQGPFFIIIEKPGINIIHAAKTITKLNISNIVDIRARGKNRVRVQFGTSNAANQLLNHRLWTQQKDVKIYIPKMYIQTIGVVADIPTNISDEEIIQNIYSAYPVQKVERITRWDRSEQQAIPTEQIKIWFRSPKKPDTVQIYLATMRVRYFIPSPILCRKCLRYGHTKNMCKDNEMTCTNCAEKHTGDCNKEMNCKYCKEKHLTTDRRCKEYIKQAKIKRIMTIKKYSYKQAMEEIKGDLTETPNNTYKTSYVAVTKLEEENKSIKMALVALQKTMDKIHQRISQADGSKKNNDLILMDIIDAVKESANQQSN